VTSLAIAGDDASPMPPSNKLHSENKSKSISKSRFKNPPNPIRKWILSPRLPI
jgi:hypothetical protein